MEVDAPQPEESTPRRQEEVTVDPWDLSAQAYQWAGQEVSKGKPSSRKGASDIRSFNSLLARLVVYLWGLCKDSHKRTHDTSPPPTFPPK